MEKYSKKMETNTGLKILNIMSGSENGGAERFFERLVCAIEKNGITQKVIIRYHKRRYQLLKPVIKNISSIYLFNQFNPFCHLAIEKIIKNFEPNVILTWMNRASKILPNERFNNEIVVGRLGGYYNLKNYSNCDYLIANTMDIKNFLIEKGWPSKKISVIPNFVNSNKETKKNINLSNNKTIISMGRFHENKGFDILIKALSFLPEFKLILVGSGPLNNFYVNLIKQYNLSKRVEIHNWTDNISKYLNSTSLLVCPSRHEPFGNIIIDGWAHKIPVIASNIGGPSILIKEGVNGLKFENEDVFDLVKKIKKLVNNKKLVEILTKNAYEDFRSQFSEKVIIEKYISFFKKIMS